MVSINSARENALVGKLIPDGIRAPGLEARESVQAAMSGLGLTEHLGTLRTGKLESLTIPGELRT